MLDERRARILSEVVKLYVSSSQAVSSGAVASSAEIGASPATVRSEMACLEAQGYLYQPHKSSGRVPTDAGYRFYVDLLSEPPTLGEAEAQDVADFFSHASCRIEDLLHSTSELLSSITNSAALVVSSVNRDAPVIQVQIVQVADKRFRAIAIFSDGNIERSQFRSESSYQPDELLKLSANLTSFMRGRLLSKLSAEEIKGSISEIEKKALDSLLTNSLGTSDCDVYVGGASRLAGSLDGVDVIREILELLEEQLVVVSLIRTLVAQNLSVSIGSELNLRQLSTCSIVTAPTIVDGKQRGSIAVLGSTRMDYPKAMAAVQAVSDELAEKIEEREH